MKKVLLISNKVMHYRVSIYNYLNSQFHKEGWELIVRSNALQKENPHPVNFDFKEVAFHFSAYKEEIERINPDAVILFVHLRDLMVWPLVHWLKIKKIPVVFWMKAKNYDNPDSLTSSLLYHYMHTICDGLILYSKHEMPHIHKRHRSKTFVASNTLNFSDYPDISETREGIKLELGIPFKKVVLSVGRMGADGGRKKIDHLIEIFKKPRVDGVGLVIVGSGVSPELLETMNKATTVYLGEVYDSTNVTISKIFKMADVFCIPGHVGLGLNQAFYWGLPVVTEEGGQPPEIHYLISGRNGFLVPNNDVEELERKIMYLLTDEAARKAFSENAREDILREASMEQMFKGFKQCLDSLG